MNYAEFLNTKREKVNPCGFAVDPSAMTPALFDWQREIIAWALKRGRAALFEDCGLGKTAQQLEWARHVVEHTGRAVLILAPLAVSDQTIREGGKFGIAVHRCNSGDDVIPAAVNVTNYERLEKFNSDPFAGIVLDESSILKAYDGKTRRTITDFAKPIKYRLCCTATPAPNDLVELCNHAEFLDIMSGKEILALYFRQDGNTTHNWRLKGHARQAFWMWMAEWSVAVRRPSDIGYPNDGYILPPLNMIQETVTNDTHDGWLFAMEARTLAERRESRKNSLARRVARAAELANNSNEQWLVWCDLNAEGDALADEHDYIANGLWSHNCQDVSVAGKRAGMSEGSGTRSSLAFEFVRLARELGPRYIIWENVAGAIDSKNAPDFLAFLRALGDCGYSLAWRVLDAQYVRVDGMERAVPQRRRRVWVVGCLGADESLVGKILFEPDCVAGHTAPRRRTGQGFTYSLARRDRVDAPLVGEPAGCEPTVARTLERRYDSSPCIDRGQNCIALDQGAGKSSVNTTVEYSPTLATTHQGEPAIALDGDKLKPREDRHGVAYETECYENHAQDSRIKPIEVSDTRNQKDGTGGNNLPLVCFSKVSHPTAPNGEGERWDEREVAQTRNTFDNGEKRCQEVIVSTNSNGEDVAATLNANMSKLGGDNQTNFGGGTSLAAVGIGHDAYNSGRNAKMGMSISSEVEPTMKAKSDGCGAVAIAREGAEGE